jgi:hydroxyacylglutathione hydrolase
VRALPKALPGFARLSPGQLRRRLKGPKPPAVLDVRTPAERKASSIPGSRHIPLGELRARLHEVPQGPLVVTCAGGYRSAMAASLLQASGRADVSDLDGGMSAWLEPRRGAR